MKRATKQQLARPAGHWVHLSPSEREEINATLAAQAAEIRRLRAALRSVAHSACTVINACVTDGEMGGACDGCCAATALRPARKAGKR